MVTPTVSDDELNFEILDTGCTDVGMLLNQIIIQMLKVLAYIPIKCSEVVMCFSSRPLRCLSIKEFDSDIYSKVVRCEDIDFNEVYQRLTLDTIGNYNLLFTFLGYRGLTSSV